MGAGSRELARGATAYLASFAFVIAFLLTTLSGGSPLTAAIRGGIVAVATLVLGGFLMSALIGTLLDAIARDRVAAESAAGEQEDGE